MKSVLRVCRAGAPVLMVIAVCILFISAATVPPELKGKGQVGEPYSFAEDKEYLTPISDYATNGHFIYVLYEERGIVKIYSEDGVYLKTHCFFQARNGIAQLISTGECVFLEDRTRNLYSFRGTEVDSFFPSSENAEMRKVLKGNALNGVGKHELADGSVLKKGLVSLYQVNSAGEQSLVVHRPFWVFLFDPIKAIILMVLSILTVAVYDGVLPRFRK